MRVRSAFLVVALCVAMPIAAFARPASQSDQAYCNKLANIYQRYIGRSFDSHRGYWGSGDLDSDFAVSECEKGDTADAIPTLERELENNGFTLPKRG
jgi:hypothetical protein